MLEKLLTTPSAPRRPACLWFKDLPINPASSEVIKLQLDSSTAPHLWPGDGDAGVPITSPFDAIIDYVLTAWLGVCAMLLRPRPEHRPDY